MYEQDNVRSEEMIRIHMIWIHLRSRNILFVTLLTDFQIIVIVSWSFYTWNSLFFQSILDDGLYKDYATCVNNAWIRRKPLRILKSKWSPGILFISLRIIFLIRNADITTLQMFSSLHVTCTREGLFHREKLHTKKYKVLSLRFWQTKISSLVKKTYENAYL